MAGKNRPSGGRETNGCTWLSKATHQLNGHVQCRLRISAAVEGDTRRERERQPCSSHVGPGCFSLFRRYFARFKTYVDMCNRVATLFQTLPREATLWSKPGWNIGVRNV